MSNNLNLQIGGRTYTVACAEGEEAHIQHLGAVIDGKLASMGDMAGQSEGRSLLFAALLLADELHEAKKAASAAPTLSTHSPAPSMGPYLHAIAEKLENLASRLEG
jgi:cell division protein ZapA